MQTNGEFLESLRPVFESIFGKDGYFFSSFGAAIALMVFFSIVSWLFRLFVRSFFWQRRGENDEEQPKDGDEEQCYEEDEEGVNYD